MIYIYIYHTLLYNVHIPEIYTISIHLSKLNFAWLNRWLFRANKNLDLSSQPLSPWPQHIPITVSEKDICLELQYLHM